MKSEAEPLPWLCDTLTHGVIAKQIYKMHACFALIN